MYNSNAQANNFVLWDKGQTRELSTVSDDAWDNTKLTWIKKYDSSEQPTQNTIWSDAYGFYDEYFRLKYDGTIYRAYDFVSFINGNYRVSSDGVYFQRWMPNKPSANYFATNAPPGFLPPDFKYNAFMQGH